MRKNVSRLQLSRETLLQLVDRQSDLRQAQGASGVPITICGNTCPPICTKARPCAG